MLVIYHWHPTNGHPHSSQCCPGGAGKSATMVCQEIESEINPSKAQALWCTLNNKAVGKAKPAVSSSGGVIARMNNLRHLRIHFNRMLTHKMQVRSTLTQVQEKTLRWKPWLQKASNNVTCSCCIRLWYSASLTMVWVSEPCHSPTCLSSTGCKTKPWESFWKQQTTYPLKPWAAYWNCQRWKQDVRQSKSKHISMQCRILRIHPMMLSEKKRDADWEEASHGWASQNSQFCMCTASQNSRKWGTGEKRAVEFKSLRDSAAREPMGTHCHEWPAGKASTEIQILVKVDSKLHDIVIYTDGSVTTDQSGWGFTVKLGGKIVHGNSGAQRITTSNLTKQKGSSWHSTLQGNDLCSTRKTFALFQGQPWGGCWEMGWSMYGPFERYHTILSRNWSWTELIQKDIVIPRHFELIVCLISFCCCFCIFLKIIMIMILFL